MIRNSIILFLFTISISAQEISPYFKNYNKQDYKGENSNWDISQNSEGTIFIANGTNLLTFNGDFWQKYKLPNPFTIRSVKVINDTVYTGSYHEFGYWLKNAKNELVYTSLSSSVAPKYFDNDEIWKIIDFKDKILFQSFGKLYVFSKKDHRIMVIPFGEISAVYSFYIGDTLYITTKNNGLYKLKDGGIAFIDWSTPLKEYTIQSLVSFNNGLLIATQLNGLYFYRDGSLSKWESSLDAKFENLEINNLKIVDGFVCIGTINHGLLILDSKGHYKYVFNKGNGFQNNTVIRQFIDNDNNLWLALDNGLSKIHLSKDIYAFNDKSGALGTVYSIISDNDQLILGSNHGVFYLKNGTLDFLKSSNGQVWNLTRVENEIICGHNNGTFIIKNGDFKQLNDINGGMDFVKIPHSSYYIQPNYTGVARYRKVNGEWLFSRYPEINFPVNKAYFDENNTLWIESAYRGIFQFSLSENHENLILKREIKSKQTQLFAVGNNIFLSRNKTILKYDSVNDTLVQDKVLEKKLRPFNEIAALNKQLVVSKSTDAFKIVDIPTGKRFNLNDDLIYSRIIKNFRSAVTIGSYIYVFMDDGFLKIAISEIDLKTVPGKAYIEKVFINGELSDLKDNDEIAYNKNAIGFWFSSKDPGKLSLPVYTYKLEGYDNSWSTPSKSHLVSYNNLPPGRFVFKVKNNVKLVESDISSFSFKILQPWFLRGWAWGIYVFILMVIFYLIHLYNKLKFVKRKRAYEKELGYEQKLVIQRQNFENSKRITQLEQDKLRAKLKAKSKELASYAALMARKEDILTEMEQEINKSNIKKDNEKLYSKLMDIKDRQSNSQDEWKLFERNFNEVHDDFFKVLQKKYPSLTPKDLKLCAYLKMNLSSKEIAPLIGITFRSIELHRYRLRKKFHLSKSQNLVKFLMKM
ncbi:YXYXY domain-containing protein [Gillisia sp. Hel_I_86]|uniref:helix-turn-helix and ligand-binding sensor domain-containing protein n=1 Tax=Gillisia sp. Hel_I_86 TaxID=1249981 RepID=UPI001199D22B|nr:triple tyrosine motif-containing protein [Gillisia sp. Hel_I_86]TVZ25890.1 YXYXY domain-containing protein [Gillisia sp. Hel_I_86]